MNSRRTHNRIAMAAGLLALALGGRASALQPDQIALIVNSNVPAGRDLAELYARVRHVPDDRILELNLPTGDDIPFDDFERIVVPQVREFLHTGNLENKVTCLVTCFGVPLRMDARINNSVDAKELDLLRVAIQPAVNDLQKPIAALEAFVSTIAPDFRPNMGMDFDSLVTRADVAVKAVNTALAPMTDKVHRAQVVSRMYELTAPLLGAVGDLQHRALELQMHPSTRPADTTNLLADRNRLNRDGQLVNELQERRYDARSRAKLREIVHTEFGGFNYVRLLRDQADYLDARDTTASFDSELAMVRSIAYSHVRWRGNPLSYTTQARNAGSIMMVSRLDGPDAASVKSLIEASVKTEASGLHGKVVVDSRGMVLGRVTGPEASFAVWDQYFRNLAHLVRTHTKLTVISDDTPELLAAHTADGVAMYVGWYSLRHYVPVCTFVPGAVGFHLASFECLSIHSPSETGWVRGLLNDGVVGTVGPVAEPYLQSFPRPDDFFPLLLTGRFSLAEAYWRTTPMVSWMQTLVGDPLYNPFKADPPLRSSDLPDRLKAVTPP